MTGTHSNRFISVHPDELKFQFELKKPSYCDIKVSNTTDQHVAFKVKTTSPKKYFVRPNTGVVQPWDSCVIRVTLQAQHEYPADMQCKDKFLLQSTTVPPHTDVDELPQNTFNKDSGKTVEDCKLKVVYVSPISGSGSIDDGLKLTFDATSNQAIQRAKDERDAVIWQTQQLQQELDMLKKRRSRRNDRGLSFRFALFVGLIGIMVGFLLNLSLSSP